MVDRTIIAFGARLVVRYMRFRNAFPAEEFYREADRPDRVRFDALARYLAEHGRLPDDSHGHFLKGRYSDVFELKPRGSRFFGFFYERNFYVTNGAPKKKKKEQEADYEIASTMRRDFLARISRSRRKKR